MDLTGASDPSGPGLSTPPARDGASPAPPVGVAGPADGLPKQLDPRTVTVERLQGLIASAVLTFLGFIAIVVLAASRVLDSFWASVALALGFAAAAGLVTLSLFWPSIRYRHQGYTVSRDGIEIRRGVLWRSVISVPRNRVQHTDVSTGLIERAFGLSTLVIYTAGTQHASVELSGLSQPLAAAIRDHLLGGEGGGDGV
jgi:membrane protein YdbS with pleckstrin-like domain